MGDRGVGAGLGVITPLIKKFGISNSILSIDSYIACAIYTNNIALFLSVKKNDYHYERNNARLVYVARSLPNLKLANIMFR